MIVNYLTKMVYYKYVKITIDILSLIKVIINVVIYYHDIFKSIITNQNSIFILKFYFLLCYFLGIKRKLFITFYLQIDS